MVRIMKLGDVRFKGNCFGAIVNSVSLLASGTARRRLGVSYTQ